MYDIVLIPIDFDNSEKTITLIEKANKLAIEKVVMLHVIEDLTSQIETFSPDGVDRENEEDAEQNLKLLLSKANIINDKVKIEVRKGSSYRNILESSKDNDANLIIINSHKPGLEMFLLGSTAEKVVRHASCSVLVERS